MKNATHDGTVTINYALVFRNLFDAGRNVARTVAVSTFICCLRMSGPASLRKDATANRKEISRWIQDGEPLDNHWHGRGAARK
ncbi:MAG: hypothetical protein HRF42_07130 [Candidatus Brocadia sp.]|jgi:hypothetical protein